MVQFYTSSGSLLSPTAPCAGLAGLPQMRTPRGIYTGSRRGLGLSPSATYYREFPRRRGLGAGSPVASQAVQIGGTAASVAIPIASSAGLIAGATAAAAIPIVGAIVALGALIASFIGGGCGNACIESSQAEQIYEVACDDLQHVAALGMIAQSDYEAAIQALVQGGQQHLAQLQQQGDKQAAAGAKNLTKSTAGNVSYASQVPASATTPLDLTKAQAVFVQPGAGWYAASVASGNQLALQYLQNLQSNSSVVSSASGTGTVSILGTTVSTSTLLLGLALLGAALYFSGSRE
jgi:hypothetical protein